MTDKEIIKALECCAKLNHNNWSDNMKICEEECPYKANCYDEENNINMITDALDLINRLQAENEKRMNIICKKEDMEQQLARERQQYYDELQRAKAEIKKLNGVIKNFKATKERQKAEIKRLKEIEYMYNDLCK